MRRVRLKLGGGHGGHNGLRDAITHCGADFWRLRLGVGHPGDKYEVIDYVLQRAPPAEENAIVERVDAAVEILPVLLDEGAEKAMNQLHRSNPTAQPEEQEPEADSRPYRPMGSMRHRRSSERGQVDALQCGHAGAERAAANYPFCTIDPNVGVVPVPDLRLEALAAIVKPEKILPTTVEFVDIAGLVAGASKGEGLGNKFLAHIRETDAIAHVVRCFVNDDIVHVAGTHRSARRHRRHQHRARARRSRHRRARHCRAEKAAKAGDKDAMRAARPAEAHAGAPRRGQAGAHAAAGRRRSGRCCTSCHLITLKPLMYVANVAEDGFENNPYLDVVRKRADEEKAPTSCPCARRSRRRSRSSTRPIARRSSRSWACTSPASIA